MMWSEIHRPKRVEQMLGNEDARLSALKWVTGWVNGSKPLLLVGSPGTGKTTFVHAVAGQFNYDLVEMNASDTRNRAGLESRIAPLLTNTSIFGRKIMLFLDEVDGISGREDTGGLDALIELLKEPTIPVIMAANSKTRIKDLAKICKVIEFKPVSPRLLMVYLNHILESQEKSLSPEQKNAVIKSSQGDIRSMINIAQSTSAGYAADSNKDIFKMDIADSINRFFSAGSSEEAASTLLRADASYADPSYGMSPEERRKDMINALYSTITSSQHLDADSLAKALDLLSRADMIVGRISKNRQWSLLRYLNDIVAYGLYNILADKGLKYNQYSMPWPVMGPVFARSQSVRKISAGLSPLYHASRGNFSLTLLPYMAKIMAELGISPEEFVHAVNVEESIAASLAKEMERARKRA